jgi:hypothetical protein
MIPQAILSVQTGVQPHLSCAGMPYHSLRDTAMRGAGAICRLGSATLAPRPQARCARGTSGCAPRHNEHLDTLVNEAGGKCRLKGNGASLFIWLDILFPGVEALVTRVALQLGKFFNVAIKCREIDRQDIEYVHESVQA